MYLAPNGKIYLFPFDVDHKNNESKNPWGSSIEITFPNKRGKDCGIREFYKSNLDIIESESLPYYEKRVDISQVDECTASHRFANSGHPSFTKLRWHFFNPDTTLVKSLYGDSVLSPLKEKGSYLILLRGEDTNGFVNWRWDSIYYSPPVTAKIHLMDSVACEFNQIQFLDSSLNKGPNENLSWKWSFFLNDQLLETSSKQNPKLSFSKEGQYSVKLSFSNGVCSDSTVKEQSLKIVDGPQPGFSLSDTLSCTPAQISINDTSSGFIKSRSFDWSDGFSATGNHSRQFVEPKSYQVVQTLTGPNGCVSKDSHHVRIRSGIAQLGRPQLLKATVLDANKILVEWDSIQQAMGYRLWRMADSSSNVSVDLTKPETTSYTDSTAKTSLKFYQYRLHPIDSCGNEGYPSNYATSLLLHTKNINNTSVVLRWNAYENWTEGVSEYVVESSENGKDWLPIDASKQLTYPDYRIPDLAADTLWYRIKAIEQNGNQQTSVSNIVQVPIGTVFIIPNAFTPNDDGINDVFKIAHFGLKDFECFIFGRNGQIIEYSTEPNAIWDGKHNGLVVPIGAYQYVIKATDTKGNKLEFDGNVTVLR